MAPALVLDVAFGSGGGSPGETLALPVRAGDDPARLSAAFAAVHGLRKRREAKLRRLIAASMHAHRIPTRAEVDKMELKMEFR